MLKNRSIQNPSRIVRCLFAFLLCTAAVIAIVLRSHQPSQVADIRIDSLLVECNGIRHTILLDSLAPELFRITHLNSREIGYSTARSLFLPYPVYKLDAGDLDRDGCLDLFVGVVKSCRFDPVIRRRLFIYTIEDGYIRSKWMGTYLGNELLDFHVLNDTDSTRIVTSERGETDLYKGLYAWGSFGPALVNYSIEVENGNETSISPVADDFVVDRAAPVYGD